MQIIILPIATIFDPIADWRKPRGKRYSLTSLLNFITIALILDARSSNQLYTLILVFAGILGKCCL